MKKSNLIMALSFLLFLGSLLFVKFEMDQGQGQQAPPQNIGRAAAAPTNNPASSVLDTLDQNLSNTVARAGNTGTNITVRELFDIATNIGHEVNSMALDATRLTDAEEIAFGKKLDCEILKDMPQVRDPVAMARLETLATNIVSQCHRSQITYHFRIVRSKMVNAFSIAGGYVYVTSSFLKRFNTDAELAMTLAHEIGHVELKHAVQKIQYQYQAGRAFGDDTASIVQLGYATLSSPFAQDDEYAADAWGFIACKKAGWNPDQLFVLFEHLEKFQQEIEARDPEPPTEFERRMGQYLSSHPPTSDRLARLKAM